MRRLTAALLVTALGVLGLAACGGDDDDDASGGDTTDAPDEGGGDTTDAPDDGDSEFAELVEKQQSARIKITYEDSSSDEPFTISQDGEGRTAYFSGDSSVTIIDGDTTTTCDGVDTDSPTCTELSGNLGDLASLGVGGLYGIWSTVLAGLGDTMFTDESSDEIAGRSATCVKWDGGPLGAVSGSFEVCADDETGFLLRMTTDQGEIVATEVGEPDDSDFEPPAPPETIPDISDITLPGGITLPGQGG